MYVGKILSVILKYKTKMFHYFDKEHKDQPKLYFRVPDQLSTPGTRVRILNHAGANTIVYLLHKPKAIEMLLY